AIEDETVRVQAIAALTELSLIKHDPFEDGARAVTAHRLVQAVARRRSEDFGTANSTVQRLITRLAAIFPRRGFDDASEWPVCAQLTSHVMALRETGGSLIMKVLQWPDLLRRVAGYLHGRASYAEAEPLMREALSLQEQALGPEHPETATCLGNL